MKYCDFFPYKRILKPRVRNAVSCFEVIWSKPGQSASCKEHIIMSFIERKLCNKQNII